MDGNRQKGLSSFCCFKTKKIPLARVFPGGQTSKKANASSAKPSKKAKAKSTSKAKAKAGKKKATTAAAAATAAVSRVRSPHECLSAFDTRFLSLDLIFTPPRPLFPLGPARMAEAALAQAQDVAASKGGKTGDQAAGPSPRRGSLRRRQR